MRATTKEKLFVLGVGVPLGLIIFYFYKLWMAPIPVDYYDRIVTPSQVTAGTEVTITWNTVRNAYCDRVIYRKLVASDGRVVLFEPKFAFAKPLGASTEVFKFTVPEFSSTGPLIYRVRAEYFCNFVQRYLGGTILPFSDAVLHYSQKGS